MNKKLLLTGLLLTLAVTLSARPRVIWSASQHGNKYLIQVGSYRYDENIENAMEALCSVGLQPRRTRVGGLTLVSVFNIPLSRLDKYLDLVEEAGFDEVIVGSQPGAYKVPAKPRRGRGNGASYDQQNSTKAWARASRSRLVYILQHSAEFNAEEYAGALHEYARRYGSRRYPRTMVDKITNSYIKANPNYRKKSSGSVFKKTKAERLGNSRRELATRYF
jgi:hypothetical protein